MHIVPIIWMLTWPALLAVSFYAVWWMVKKFESRLEDKHPEN